jgi:hypothetical protein
MMTRCPNCGGSFASPNDLDEHKIPHRGMWGGLSQCEWLQQIRADQEKETDA